MGTYIWAQEDLLGGAGLCYSTAPDEQVAAFHGVMEWVNVKYIVKYFGENSYRIAVYLPSTSPQP